MASTVKVPLGAPTYGRKWMLDVNVGTYGAPTWTGVFGVIDCTPFKINPNTLDQSDFDGAGYTADAVSGMGWGIDLTVERKVTTALATAYDVGQEALRTASLLMGIANRVDIRFYEVTASGPKVEAYRGYVRPVWGPSGGDDKSKVTVAINLIGQGAYEAITHPDYAAAVPILYSVTPATAAAAGGSLHALKGVNFFAAGVDDVVSMAVGVTDIPTFVTDDDQTIHFVMPAKVAGTWALTVTNATGVSTVTVNIVTS